MRRSFAFNTGICSNSCPDQHRSARLSPFAKRSISALFLVKIGQQLIQKTDFFPVQAGETDMPPFVQVQEVIRADVKQFCRFHFLRTLVNRIDLWYTAVSGEMNERQEVT